MDEEKIKAQIGANIAMHRKNHGWTQIKLAERINYSDKAISKWERGESIPDVITLMLLAKEFGTTLNDLTNLQLDEIAELPRRKADHGIILRLTNVLVWFIALFSSIVFKLLNCSFFWIPFIYGIPITSIVQLSLRSAWRDFHLNQLLISLITWGTLASIYVTLFYALEMNFWLIFLLGIPGQIAIYLWFRMYTTVGDAHTSITEEDQNG